MIQTLANQIVDAYQVLERENAILKMQLEIMQRENGDLTRQLEVYELAKMPKEPKEVVQILLDGFTSEIAKANVEKDNLTKLYETAEENRKREARKLSPEYDFEKVKPFEWEMKEYAKKLEEVTARLKILKSKRTAAKTKLNKWNNYEAGKRPRTNAMEKCISCNAVDAKFYMPMFVCSEKCARNQTRKSLGK